PGLLRSAERPDKTMTVAAYFHAAFAETGDPFTAGPDGLSRAHATLHGTNDTSTGTPLPFYNAVSQPLPSNFRLVTGKSTLSRTLLGENGLPLVTEQQALVGDWVVTGQDWVSYVNSIYPSSTKRRSSRDGLKWSVVENTWTAGRLTATTDSNGIRQTFGFDSVGRVETTTRDGASLNGDTIAAQSILHTHDAAGRLKTRTVSAAGEALVSASEYDTAGRVTSETAPGRGTTRYSYSPESRLTTVTLPTGATRTETRLPDGRVAAVEGSAVVAEYYQYAIEPDGRRKTTVRPRGLNDVRKQEVWTDWLNRPLQRSRPGFNNAATLAETMSYDPSTGQLTTSSRTGYADTRYLYNSMGEMIHTGLDLNGGGLDRSSTDRITDSDQSVELHDGAYWLTRRTWALHQHRIDARIPLEVARQRLTGRSPSLRAESRSRDAEDNESIRTVTVDAANKLVTVTSTAPGLASPATEVALAGFTIASTGHDGLTYRNTYDALGRLRSVVDPRTGPATITYVANTLLPDERRDAANRLMVKTGYDSAGQPTFVLNAENRTIRTEYNARGQVLRRWGSATYPVTYSYDAYGQRTHQQTYRDPTGSVLNFWEATSWPGSAVPAQVTEWEFDDYTGWMKKKFEAGPERKFVEYTYNERGQTHQRFWARTVNGQRVTTTYDYFSGTGEPRSISYSDGTPPVSFQALAGESYSRLGQPLVINDATGARDFVYDPAAPWRLATEVLSTFYGSRQLASLYESATSANAGSGGYTGHALGTVRGRSAGFRLGANPTPTSYDLEVTYGASNAARFAGLVARRASGTAIRQLVYGYEPTSAGPASALVKTLSVAGSAFQVSRSFDSTRDLVTAIDTLWSGSSCARYDYTYNHLRQRESVAQSGNAFADLGATHQRFTYNPRGELTSARWYNGINQ
ncbi:MAG: hypothetical protein QG597_5183, partial [Actinomycetota bacterium]|nr:hypothetical protein [Actinomycetota bacterium]